MEFYMNLEISYLCSFAVDGITFLFCVVRDLYASSILFEQGSLSHKIRQVIKNSLLQTIVL